MIRLIIILILLILVLSYFDVNIQSIVESPRSQSNFGYVSGLIQKAWNKYLAAPVNYLWRDVFINLLWDSFTQNMERIKGGQPTNLELLAPQV